MIDIKRLLQSRVAEYDPSLSTDEGSAFYNAVIRPLEQLFSVDPLQTDARSFLRAKLSEAYPDLPLSEGDALSDVLINAVSLFFDAYRAELQNISQRQSVSNVGVLADEDVDDLAANWLVSRKAGGRATSSVRITVSSATPIEVTQAVLFTTPDGISFSPDGTFTISTQELIQRQLAPRQFYYDIPVVAVEEGTSGNVAVGSISSALNINNVISVSNTLPGSGGRDPEASDTLVRSRLANAVSERSLVTARGAAAQLLTDAPDVLGVYVAGMGDPNMQRDRVEVGGLGELVASGAAVLDPTRSTVYLLLSTPSLPIIPGQTLSLRLLGAETYVPEYTAALPILSVAAQAKSGALTLCVVGVAPDDVLLRADRGLHLGCVCAVYAEPSAVIDGERIEAGTSLGGRSDIHVNPDSDVLVTSEFGLRGSGFVASGLGVEAPGGLNTVTVLGVPAGTDCVGLYLSVAGSSGFYQVLYQDSVEGGLLLTLDRVYPTAVTAVTAPRWRLYRGVELAQGPRTVHAPLPSGSLLVSGLIGSTQVQYESSDALETLGLPTEGLTLVVRGEDTFELSIASIGSRITTLTPLPLTISKLRAEIVEAVPQLPLPLTHVNSLTADADVPRSEALGLRLLSVTEPRVTQSGLVGHVSPKLHHAFGASRIVSGNNAALPLLRTLAMDADSYTALAEGGSVSPYELGLALPRAGSCAVRVAIPRPDQTVDYVDVSLPTELFVPGRYNVFVGTGNISYSDLTPLISNGFRDPSLAPFPLNMQRPVDAQRGDIVEIEAGSARGSYVVDEVFDIELPVGFIRTSVSVGMNEGTLPAYVVDRSCVLRLSVVRVYGELPPPPAALMEPDMRLPASPVAVSGSTSITIDALLRCLMAPDTLVTSTLNTSDLLSEALERRVGIPYSTAAVAQLPSQLMRGSESTYRVGRPGVGRARLLFQDAGSPRVYLPYVDHVSHWVVNDTLSAVRDGEPLTALPPSRRPSGAVRGALELVFDDEFQDIRSLSGESAQDPVGWGRDVQFFPADSGSGLRLLRPSAIDRQGLLSLGVDQDEYGYDVARMPTRYGPVGASVDPALGDELWTLPEALFMEHEAFGVAGDFLGRLVSNTPASGALLILRGGVLMFEPQVPNRPASVSVADWNNFVRAEWDVRRVILPESRWAYIRDLVSAGEAAQGYPRITELCENGTYTNLRNLNGQTVLEWLSAAALAQPDSVLLISTRAQLSALATPPVVRAAEVFRRVTRVASTRKYGLPTITTQRGSSVVYINKVSAAEADGLPDLSQDLVGAYLHIDQGPDEGGYTIRGVSPASRAVTLDRPLTSSTPTIEMQGVCGASTGGTVKLAGYRSALDSVDSLYKYPTRTEVVDADHDAVGTYPAFGVTTRMMTQGDVDKYITLYNFARPSEADGVAPTRRHLGSFKISAINTVSNYDTSVGRSLAVSQTLTLDGFSGVGSQDIERCFYVVSSELIEPDAGELKGLRPAHIYESEPLKYPIIGAETTFGAGGGRRVAVVTAGGLIPSAVSTQGPFAQIDSARDIKNPTIIVRRGEADVELTETLGLYGADVRVRTRTLAGGYVGAVGQTFRTDVQMPGYRVETDAEGLSFSVREGVRILVNTATDAESASVESMYAPAVYSVNSKIQLSSNRVICADLLARRMAPAYVGVRLVYVGPVAESAMRQAVAEAVRVALSSSGSLSASDIIAIAYQRGATKVGQPLEMFYVVEGRDRRRHIEYVTGTLTARTISGFSGSIETTSVRAGTDARLCLGVDIYVTRVASAAQLGE